MGDRRASLADLDDQLDAFAELDSIDNRLRWAPMGGIERFILRTRRAELTLRIDLWNRRFAHAEHDEDVRGHAAG